MQCIPHAFSMQRHVAVLLPYSCCTQGAFTVTSQLPVQYTITQVQGIFDLQNKVGFS